jgi:hypothetical protein
MAPIPNSEMLDELAVIVMDMQVELSEETIKGNVPAKKEIIRKMIETTAQKFSPIPEFDDGELRLTLKHSKGS